MKNKVKYLSKNILLFTISGFVPKILSFFLIPIYTRCLTTGDYGVADLITTTVSLIIPIFTLDIQDAVLIFSMDKKYNKKDVFSVAMKINFFGFAIVTFVTLLLWFFKFLNINGYVYIFFLITYFATAFSNSINLFCKGIDRVKELVISSLINSIFTLSLNILFLKVLNLGIIGYLISNSVGIILSLLYIFCKTELYKYIVLKSNSNLFKEMVKFSFPLIFSVIAWWINNASDRYILTWITGISVSGLYAISYKIPNLLSTFQNIFAQAWSISAVKEFDRNDEDGFVGKMYSLMNFSMCFICSIIMVFNVFIAKLLYADTFFEAWKFVPPLLISVVFNAMSLFIGSIFTAVKDTKTLSKSTIIGAIVNTLLNFILIYYFAAYGAAMATLIGYFVVLIMRNIILKKHIHMKTNNLINNLCYLFLLIQMFFAYFGNNYIILQLAISLIIVILYKNYIYDIINFVKKFKKKENKND